MKFIQLTLKTYTTGNDQADTLYMKELLIIAGLCQTDVARELGVKKTIVNRVVLRKDNSTRVLDYFVRLHEQFGDVITKLNLKIMNMSKCSNCV